MSKILLYSFIIVFSILSSFAIALISFLNLNIEENITLEATYIVFSVSFIIVCLVYFLVKRNLSSYLLLYKKFKTNMNSAKNGKFIPIKTPKNFNSEFQVLIDDYNNMIQNFSDTSYEIDEKLQRFIGFNSRSNTKKNPIEESKEIIKDLSKLFQFKKQVELDNTKQEIYDRISEVFQNTFEIKNFTFFELDTKSHKLNKVIEVGNSFQCHEGIKDSPELCRAARTKSDVVSIRDHKSCPYFNEENHFHYCININIFKDLDLVINFVTDNLEELDRIKKQIEFIKKFLREARPSIEVKMLMHALKESAFKDGLTNTYNRKYLDEHMKKLLPQVKRDNKNIGLLMLDMDHFKAVNDEYGHDIGDKVLKVLSGILLESVRESDIVVRYGGEEFMVLLVGINDANETIKVAEKISQSVREREIDVYAGNTITKTISIGVSMFPEDSNSFDMVIKNADIALYKAKSTGRDKVVRYEKEQLTSVDLF